MEKLFLELLNRSITAGWLILAAVLIRLLFRRAPKWVTGCLWILVAVRLLIPFSVESVYSLIPTAETVPYEILYSETPAIDSGVPVIDWVVNLQLAESYTPVTGASVNPLQIVTAVSSYLWIAGLAAMLTTAAVSYLLLKRRVRTAVRLRENIKQSERIDTPFVLGLLRPTVYLPYDVGETETEYIIAHEKNHIRRGDHLIKPFAYVLLSVYWFNPLMWAAYILLCRDIELACDERVIKNMSTDERKAYSTVLLEFSTKQRLITACPVAFGEVGVKTRIKSVLNYRKPTFWVIVLALAACVICGVCLLTDPEPIEGLPAAEEISHITISNYPAIREIGANDTSISIAGLLETLGTATKTSTKHWDDRPYEGEVDNGTYLELTFHYADEAKSPSSQTYYLYSQKGKTYLMRPYDAVYRIDREFYTGLSSFYFSEQEEEVRNLYLDLNHEKIAVENDLTQQIANHQQTIEELQVMLQNERGTTEELQTALKFERAYTEEVMAELMKAAREDAADETSGQPSEYYYDLFEQIADSVKVSGHWVTFTLPDAPEIPYLTIHTVGRALKDGISDVRFYGTDCNIRHTWESGEPFQIPTDDLTWLTMHLSVISADGLCEVSYDLEFRD